MLNLRRHLLLLALCIASAAGPLSATLQSTEAEERAAATVVRTRGDFTGDGQSDLILQDAAGNLAAWLMNGTSLDTGSSLVPGEVGDPNWRVAGSGDFNLDGWEDVLFQHADGTLAVWSMLGTGQVESELLRPSHPGDKNWRVAVTGDFNEDGRIDLVFQHGDGTLAVWYLKGTELGSTALFSPANAGGINWRAVGAGDFNADGHTDLIFQHSDGTLAAWLLDGVKLIRSELLSPPDAGDKNWRVVSTVQFGLPYAVSLSGGGERPEPIVTSATGSGELTLLGNTLSYAITFSGLSSPAVAAHVHGPGTIEQTAGVLMPLADVSGSFGVVHGEIELTDAQAALLRDGLTYLDLHTGAHPTGEIRGQITRNLKRAGQVDLVFQHTNGGVAVWFLDGIRLISVRLLPSIQAGQTWRIVAPK